VRSALAGAQALRAAQSKAPPNAPAGPAPHVQAATQAARRTGSQVEAISPPPRVPAGSGPHPLQAKLAPHVQAATRAVAAPPPVRFATPATAQPKGAAGTANLRPHHSPVIQRAAEKHDVSRQALDSLVDSKAFAGAHGAHGAVSSLVMDYFAPSEVKTFYQAIGHHQGPVEGGPRRLASLADLEDEQEYLFVITTDDARTILYCPAPIEGSVGHTSLSDESLASYAGVFSRILGVLVWSNSSGHYKPKKKDKAQALLTGLLDVRYFIGQVDDDDDEWEDLRKCQNLPALQEKCAEIRDS
jgi:hypothetical protein